MLTQARLKDLLNYDQITGVFTWRMRTSNCIKVGDVAGADSGHGYLLIGVDGRRYKAHRLAWLYVHGHFPIEVIDHINGIGDDNRLCNLRSASYEENARNAGAKSSNKSGLKGVCRNGNGWSSFCNVNGKQNYLGYFDSPEKAFVAYKAFAQLHHGAFYKGE